jgi:hypothetical protein
MLTGGAVSEGSVFPGAGPFSDADIANHGSCRTGCTTASGKIAMQF